MAATGFALFGTAIGRCAIAWNARGGIAGLQLPEKTVAAARTRMRSRYPSARELEPPANVSRVIARVTTLLDGRAVDLSGIALDMEGLPPFHRRVYEAARAVPRGATRSYGEIAHAAGSPASARAVGQAMRRNPFPIVVPCHRVLAAGGKTGGFTAEGGVTTKMRMLALEGWPGAAATASKAAGKASRPADLAAAVRHLRRADPELARLIKAVGPCRMQVERTRSMFGALARAIVYQQLTGKAAATIHSRVAALFPHANGAYTPEDILAASDESLRAAGLSRAKAAALRDLARKVLDGEVPTLEAARRLPDDEIVERLTIVRGIGRWTAEMLLMFRLGRPDVLPVDDYGVRKGFRIAFDKRTLPSKEALTRRAQRWRPYRSVASWYMWRACDLEPSRLPRNPKRTTR